MKQTIQLCHANILNPEDAQFWEKDVAEEKNVESVSNLFHELMTSWDCDGIGRIYRSRSVYRRLIWIILWIIMLCIGSYQCYTTYQAYDKHDKTVTIDIVNQDLVEFPAVTFCTLNPFSPQTEDWYENNPNWSPFLEFQNEYAHPLTPGKCADNASYADQPSLQDNENAINLTDATEGNFSLYTYSDLSLPSGSINSDGTNRRRRSASLTTLPLSSTELLNTRINCSLTFQRLLHEYNLVKGNDQPETLKIGDTSNCRELGNFTNREKLVPDAICWVPIVRDVYGFYTTETSTCNPVLVSKFNSTANQICSTCCPIYSDACVSEAEYKINLQAMDHLTPNKDDLVNLVEKSKTLDGSDLNGKFTVSPSDIENSAAPINKVILTCSFDQQKCSLKEFQQWNSERYGRCYTFNSAFYFNSSNITSTKANVRQTFQYGPKNGLRLTLDIKSNNILDILSPDIGLRVVFHKPDTIPIPEDEGINVLPGVSTSIQLTVHEVKRIKPPCGKCAEVDWKPQYNYTRTACQKLCLEQLYISQCNCYVGLSPAYSNLTKPANLLQCSVFNFTQKFCMDNIIFSFYNGDINCQCPQSCDEWSYSAKLTSSVSNKKYYKILQAIKGVKLGDDICTGSDNSTIRMQVYLKALAVERLEENEAYTIATLVSNIGGSMALFLGVSIASCLELLEFFFNTALFYVKKLCCYKKQAPNTKRSHVYIIHEKIGDHDLALPRANQEPMILRSLDAYNHYQDGNMKAE